MKWYIITLNGLYTRQAYKTKKEAVELVSNTLKDTRKHKHLTTISEGFYQYFYNTQLFWVIEEEYAINNGYDWILTEMKMEVIKK